MKQVTIVVSEYTALNAINGERSFLGPDGAVMTSTSRRYPGHTTLTRQTMRDRWSVWEIIIISEFHLLQLVEITHLWENSPELKSSSSVKIPPPPPPPIALGTTNRAAKAAVYTDTVRDRGPETTQAYGCITEGSFIIAENYNSKPEIECHSI